MIATDPGQSPLTIELTIEADDWRGPFPQAEAICAQTLTMACAAALHDAAVPSGVEVSLVLLDDAAMRDLNRRFRQQDKATNVLSFPALDRQQLRRLSQGGMPPWHPPGKPVALGDIALGLETVMSEAAAQNKQPEAHFRHLLIHGFLHLLGHDHIAPDDADEMERLEAAILAAMGLDDPYEERALATIKAGQ